MASRIINRELIFILFNIVNSHVPNLPTYASAAVLLPNIRRNAAIPKAGNPQSGELDK
jgi:hypothetical protein